MSYADRGYRPVTISLPMQYIRTIRLGTVFTLHLSSDKDYHFIEYLFETYLPTTKTIPKVIRFSPYCTKVKKKVIIREDYIATIQECFGSRALNRTILYFIELYLLDNPDLEKQFERAKQ